MKCFNDLDEEIELINKAMEVACLIDNEDMEIYEEYCQMKQFEKYEEYWLDAENNELAKQWYEHDEPYTGWNFD